MTSLRIGDLARLGGVSVRMLRHYHEIELLVPRYVDAVTGYRSYDTSQLEVLRRIVALKGLGLSLSDVGDIVNGAVDDRGIHTLLIARRSTLVQEIDAARAGLDAIDRYLGQLDSQAHHHQREPLVVEVKSTDRRTVAQLSAVAESWAPTDIGPVIQPLYPELLARLQRAGLSVTGPSTAWYEDTDDGRVLVHATLTIDHPAPEVGAGKGFDVVELPALAYVASTLHHGPMRTCDLTYEALLAWITDHAYVATAYGREIDIECGPDKEWITEIQIPIARSAEEQP